MDNEDKKFLSAEDVVARWDGAVNKGTLANWRSKGKGPSFTKFGANVRYPLDKLIEWEAKNLVANNDNHPAEAAVKHA